MAKLRVQGPGAGALLDRVSAGAVNGAAETITYTQWLDEDGHIEADLTVTKLAEDDFFVVASDTAHGHVLAWLSRPGVPDGVTLADVTADYAQLNVQGPRSRDTLASLTDADLSTEVFPFRTARWIEVAGVHVLCARITYLGELGYELYVPAAEALSVYDALGAAGAAYGIVPVGLKALASLRMEKGYRDFGHDIDNTDCPLEVGLGFAVAMDKPGGFVGRDALTARKAANQAAGGMSRRLIQLRLLDPEPLLYHAEVVYRRRRRRGLRPGRVVRLDPRLRGRAGHGGGRRRDPSPRTGCPAAPGRSTSPARATTPRCRCGRCTTPPPPGSGSDRPGSERRIGARFGQDRPVDVVRLSPDGRPAPGPAGPGAGRADPRDHRRPRCGQVDVGGRGGRPVSQGGRRPDGRLPPRRRRAAPARAARAQGCAGDVRRVGVRRAAEPAA